MNNHGRNVAETLAQFGRAYDKIHQIESRFQKFYKDVEHRQIWHPDHPVEVALRTTTSTGPSGCNKQMKEIRTESRTQTTIGALDLELQVFAEEVRSLILFAGWMKDVEH
jgi:hypothetical protein